MATFPKKIGHGCEDESDQASSGAESLPCDPLVWSWAVWGRRLRSLRTPHQSRRTLFCVPERGVEARKRGTGLFCSGPFRLGEEGGRLERTAARPGEAQAGACEPAA